MRESPFQTRITAPVSDVEPLMEALADAGFMVLDSGERVTTEDALEGEATLELLDLPDGAEVPEAADPPRDRA